MGNVLRLKLNMLRSLDLTTVQFSHDLLERRARPHYTIHEVNVSALLKLVTLLLVGTLVEKEHVPQFQIVEEVPSKKPPLIESSHLLPDQPQSGAVICFLKFQNDFVRQREMRRHRIHLREVVMVAVVFGTDDERRQRLFSKLDIATKTLQGLLVGDRQNAAYFSRLHVAFCAVLPC
jgi:hypothetical protein